MLYENSDDFLMANKIEEYGDIIFIKPHAQFQSYDPADGRVLWSDVFQPLPVCRKR